MCDTGYYGYENVNTMVHAAIGYLTADLADSKTPISIALANGVNAYAVEAIKKDKNLKAYFDDNPALLRLVSIGIGAGIGGLTGDGNADVWSGASSAQNATRWNGQNYVQQKETTEKLNNAQNQDEVIEALAKASEQSKQNIENRENGNIELYEFTESIIPEYAEALNNVTRHENGVGEHYNVDESVGLDKNLDNLANGTFFYPYYGGKILKDVFEGGVMLVAGTIVGNVYGIGKAGMFLLQNGIGQGVEYLRDKNANNPNIDTHAEINIGFDALGFKIGNESLQYNTKSLILSQITKQVADVVAMKEKVREKVRENAQKGNKK